MNNTHTVVRPALDVETDPMICTNCEDPEREWNTSLTCYHSTRFFARATLNNVTGGECDGEHELSDDTPVWECAACYTEMPYEQQRQARAAGFLRVV